MTRKRTARPASWRIEESVRLPRPCAWRAEAAVSPQPGVEEDSMTTFVKRLAIVVALVVVAAVSALVPASAAGKLSLWRLKTYIPPADKILDANAKECAKKVGVELAIQ